MEIVRSRGSYSSCSLGARKDGTFRPKESSGYMFLPLLGSCAVVRPPDAEKDKQSNKWGSGIYGAFLKEVLSFKLALSNVECRTCHGINWVNEVRMGLHSIQECHQLLI